MKIGYIRVNNNPQDLELQKQALLNAGCKKAFSESANIKDNKCTELRSMIELLRSGDIVVVYKIEEITKSLKVLFEIIALLKSKNIDLISLYPLDNVDTTSPTGKVFFQMAGIFAKIEHNLVNARIKAGVAKAKHTGTKFGRTPGSKNKSTPSKIEKITIFLKSGKSYDWIAKELSVSKGTIAAIKLESFD